jgi:glycine cleavage system H protein
MMEENRMNIPAELKYTASHEWLKDLGGGKVEIGLTDFAQDSLGDIVFVNLPESGDPLVCGESFADVESVKAVSDVFSPVSGTVCSVNTELADNPALINSDPYGAWLVRAEGITSRGELLDADAYKALCEKKEG